jgi:hypothetical protein
VKSQEAGQFTGETGRRRTTVVVMLLAGLYLLCGCSTSQKPEGALSISELLENPAIGTEVKVYGQVGLLGELFCSCFELESGGKKVLVWYGTMVSYNSVTDDGSERPTVSVAGIDNGDRVVVTGEPREASAPGQLLNIWASAIERSP